MLEQALYYSQTLSSLREAQIFLSALFSFSLILSLIFLFLFWLLGTSSDAPGYALRYLLSQGPYGMLKIEPRLTA